jgi:1-acyl-sn-glycerol-3-phosphate acyltransferase
MDSFEPAEMPSRLVAASGERGTDGEDSGGLADDDLEAGLLCSSREAFVGFSNLAAVAELPNRGRPAPWRVTSPAEPIRSNMRSRHATRRRASTANRVSGPFGYRLAKAVLRRPLGRAYDIEIDGVDCLPDGSAIVAANHRSFMDSLFLALVVDRPVSFLAKAEYFDRRRTAWIFRSTGQIPLRRGSPAGARQALDAALDVLARGGVVGVYPEGTRSRDGLLHRGNLGPARLAATSGAPIVPVGLVGTDAVQAPDQRVPRVRKHVTVRFGSPLQLDTHDANHRTQLRNATDELMADIAALSGQTYVDRYARLVEM